MAKAFGNDLKTWKPLVWLVPELEKWAKGNSSKLFVLKKFENASN